jgi:hypothetical protein
VIGLLAFLVVLCLIIPVIVLSVRSVPKDAQRNSGNDEAATLPGPVEPIRVTAGNGRRDDPGTLSSDKAVGSDAPRRFTDEEDLRKQLLLVPEVSLNTVPGTVQGLFVLGNQVREAGGAYPGPMAMASERADLAGLPFRSGIDCQLGKEPAENLQALSRRLRVLVEASIPKGSGDVRPDADLLRQQLRQADWLKSDVIPAVLQLFQGENKPVRLVMIELLSKIRDPRATEALATRAVFDLAAEVRDAAVQALKDRPSEDYRTVLTTALRYPWEPVADHAAEALETLRVKDVAPELVKLLDEPDPRGPFTEGPAKRPRTVVRELVRINHLGNCLLCHCPSFTLTDLVRGSVPTPGRELPAPVTTPQYYDRGDGAFVRADVTYLRQDFSVMQTVSNPGAWPANQRYDYLVRTRPATAQELRAWSQREDKTASGQREVVLRVLRTFRRQEEEAKRGAEERARLEAERAKREAERARREAEERATRLLEEGKRLLNQARTEKKADHHRKTKAAASRAVSLFDQLIVTAPDTPAAVPAKGLLEEAEALIEGEKGMAKLEEEGAEKLAHAREFIKDSKLSRLRGQGFQADHLLQMAKEQLQQVIDKYPKTECGPEARTLLEGLK